MLELEKFKGDYLVCPSVLHKIYVKRWYAFEEIPVFVLIGMIVSGW